MNKHISYKRFKEWFGDRGVTEWVKYNWLSSYTFNLWDEEWRLGYFDTNGVFSDRIPAIQRLCSKNPIKVTPKSTIKVNVMPTDAFYVYQYDSDMNFISEAHFSDGTLTVSDDCSYIHFSSRDNKTGYSGNIIIYQDK